MTVGPEPAPDVVRLRERILVDQLKGQDNDDVFRYWLTRREQPVLDEWWEHQPVLLLPAGAGA